MSHTTREVLLRRANRVFDTAMQKTKAQVQIYRTNVAQKSQKKMGEVRSNISHSMSMYEDFIGIKQVKEAHDRVLQNEDEFKVCQEHRRAAQDGLSEVQNQLRVLRTDIDRTARGDNRYLDLIKREIELINEERSVRAQFENMEQKEREAFSALSTALRHSHEKERAQNEKTKYWSITGSLIGACVGIVGTTINSRMRHNQTKDILDTTSTHVLHIQDSVQTLVTKVDNLSIAPTWKTSATSGGVASSSEKVLKEQMSHVKSNTDAVLEANSSINFKIDKLLNILRAYQQSGLLLVDGQDGYSTYRLNVTVKPEVAIATGLTFVLGILLYKFL